MGMRLTKVDLFCPMYEEADLTSRSQVSGLINDLTHMNLTTNEAGLHWSRMDPARFPVAKLAEYEAFESHASAKPLNTERLVVPSMSEDTIRAFLKSSQNSIADFAKVQAENPNLVHQMGQELIDINGDEFLKELLRCIAYENKSNKLLLERMTALSNNEKVEVSPYESIEQALRMRCSTRVFVNFIRAHAFFKLNDPLHDKLKTMAYMQYVETLRTLPVHLLDPKRLVLNEHA